MQYVIIVLGDTIVLACDVHIPLGEFLKVVGGTETHTAKAVQLFSNHPSPIVFSGANSQVSDPKDGTFKKLV